MSSFLQKIVQILPQIKTTDDLKRLFKWLIGCVTFIVWYKYYKARKHDNITMMPNFHPLTGHLLVPFKNWSRLTQHTYDLVKSIDFPPLAAMTTYRPLYGIFIMDPKLIKFIYNDEFEKFHKGDRMRMELSEMLGDGIFTSDPPRWRFHRKIASRMFSMRNLKDYMFECTMSHMEKVMNKFNEDHINKNDTNIYNMLARSIAFGKSVGSIEIFPKEHEFATAFDNLIESLAFRHVTPHFIWRFFRLLPFSFGNEGNIKRDMKIINKFANSVIDSRQHSSSGISDEFGKKYNDIISLFIKFSEKKLSRNELKYIAMNMIIAGRDTTRLMLSWFLYEMTKKKNKQILDKIYKEIDDFIENNNGNINIKYEQVAPNLLYLESTLLETLRMNPVVPWLIRHAQTDVKLPNGNIIREGNEVIIPTYIIGRSPKIYNNPLQFDPNRFYNKKKKDGKTPIAPINVFSVWEYPFFNMNPRLCLGRQLALMEAKIFIFYFFQKYNFEMADPNQKIQIATGLVLNMKNDGLRLKLIDRKY